MNSLHSPSQTSANGNDLHVEPPRYFAAYVLLEKVGRGGMGTVYKARRQDTGEIVAVKISSQRAAGDPVLRARFENECLLSCQFQHPRVVRALEHGVSAALPYLVMEFVPGRPLNKVIQARTRLPEDEAVAIILQVAEALTYLHEKQCVHRDVKPENILVTPDGQVKLADLGLIKDLESTNGLTRSCIGLGTFEYSAPEQYDDARSADARSDIYSLAATLYGALTGLFPFGTGGHMTVLGRKLKNEFEAPRAVNPDISEKVNNAICRALQARREDRPATIAEFTTLLQMGGATPTNGAAPATTQHRESLRREPLKDDRRTRTRFPVDLNSSCEPVARGKRDSWRATVQDVSSEGLCLRVQRRFESGTLLRVALEGLDESDSSHDYLVRVCWVKEQSARVWLLGCNLTQPLTDSELEHLCFEGAPKTAMMRASVQRAANQ